MYKISFFVPLQASEKVKQAMFSAMAGRIGNYAECCFETLGTGQFRALQGANPSYGKVGELFKIPELKVEMVCEGPYLKDILRALILNHPYETPAYEVIKLEDISL